MDFVPVRVYDDYISAHLAMGRLEQECVRCWLKDENTVTVMPVWGHAVGGIKLMVAQAQAERAIELLTAIEARSRSAISCPACRSVNLELVSTPRKAINWLSALSTFFLGNFAISVEKVYHCFDCGHEFDPSAGETDLSDRPAGKQITS